MAVTFESAVPMICSRIKNIGVITFYAFFLLFSADLIAYGDIYRYIDENGVMHFTNTPTSSNQKFKLFLREKPKITSRYSTKKYDDIIADASQQYGVSFPLLKAIIKAESGFNPRAVSKNSLTVSPLTPKSEVSSRVKSSRLNVVVNEN